MTGVDVLSTFWPYGSTAALAAVLGYEIRMLHERYILKLREREQALLALSGELPDWEQRARAQEDEADRDEIEGYHTTASEKRSKARRIRRVALRRLRHGRAALPW